MSIDTTDATDAPIDPEVAIDRAEGAKRELWRALRNVQDPELPVSIVDLGLVYDVAVRDGRAEIALTLTYSGCPARDIITGDVRRAVYGVEGVEEVDVSVVYSPPWDYDRITERGRRELNEWGIAVPGDHEAPDPACHGDP